MSTQLIAFPNFVGGTYALRSHMGDDQRSVNLFPEVVESKAGKNLFILYRKPGLSLFCKLPNGPVQAMYELNGRCWAASGNHIYELFANGTFADRGIFNAPSAGTYVGIVGNSANQLFIVSPPNGWILNTSTEAFTEISTTGGSGGGFLGAQTGTMVDGYFIANAPGTPTISVSQSEDGTTWMAINQQSTSEYPDNIIAVDNLVHYLMLFGEYRSGVYYDTGSNSTIFAEYEGSYQYEGLVAPWSRAYLDNTIFYLGQSFTGAGVVYRLAGFVPKRVSDHSFEQEIQNYPTIADAIAYSYQEAGHFFYVITFPSANPIPGGGALGATWVYDVTTDKWHERGQYNGTYDTYGCELCWYHANAFGQHLVGSHLDGSIYVQSLDNATDAGTTIRCLRQAPHIYSKNVRIFYYQLILDMQVGDGTVSGKGSNPVVGMQYSDDGGQSWSNEVQAPIGALGKYRQRVTFNRCGYARDRLFRIIVTDPIPQLCIVNAYLVLAIGDS